MSDDAFALDIKGLHKRFDKPAVDNLDLRVKQGEFYALLGPNGAGKTTILRMVAGLLPPDAGEISVCGIDTRFDPVGAKSQVAWVSDEPMVYDRLTPLEYLRFIAGLWHVPAEDARLRAYQLLDWLELTQQANSYCGGFSKGMLQKVALAGALIHDPRLIILDEPLTGLDAGSARQVKNVLKEKVSQGVTIVMTTHILEVAERMAERIGVIAKGRLIAEGTLAELQVQAGRSGSSLEDVFLDLVGQGEPQVLEQTAA
ncbi:MAG: ABC transporter ATP-binding protein [Hyphomicrobiaceae bacterium]|nr:ABC transporter ATP-binding protein [Hyphomicrobiaceae bacterium]